VACCAATPAAVPNSAQSPSDENSPNVLDFVVRSSTFATSAAESEMTWLRSSSPSPMPSRYPASARSGSSASCAAKDGSVSNRSSAASKSLIGPP
jgi:hypothetical protein